jgi:hypothetical protein
LILAKGRKHYIVNATINAKGKGDEEKKARHRHSKGLDNLQSNNPLAMSE